MFEDHRRECVACRGAVERVRSGDKVAPMPARVTRPAAMPRWALAAVVLAAGVGAFATLQWVAPGLVTGPVAAVESVHGTLYHVSSRGALPAGQGQELAPGEDLRTARDSTATVRLADGSRVEMNERAAFSVQPGWRGTTIRLERGQIIVQAARQKHGRLYVSAGDCQVAVKGTIFSVNRGTVGARVAVVEGEVEVAQGGKTESLKPGDQTTTTPALAGVPVEEEVAWSRDAGRYLALLGEFHALEKKLEAMPGPGLRFGSRLLVFVPEDTRLFIAMPNMETTLVEMRRIFEDRLRESAVLRQWWTAPENARMRAEVGRALEFAREFSSHLGEEISRAVGGTPDSESPLLIAEIKDAGVARFLDAQLAQARGARPPFAYAVRNQVLLIGADGPQLARAEAAARGGSASSGFRQRIAQSYKEGAGWLFCANMEQIAGRIVPSQRESMSLVSIGFDSAQYLVFEHREVGGRTENRAALSFRGERQGIASWLAAPGPLSTLDFVSPEASLAIGMVVKSPRVIVEELFKMAGHSDEAAEFERTTGVRVLGRPGRAARQRGDSRHRRARAPAPQLESRHRGELARPPAVEHRETARRRQPADRRPGPHRARRADQRTGRRPHLLQDFRCALLPVDLHYAFVDNYFVMASDRTLLTQAIQQRQTGYTLARSERFRAQLPHGGNPNFSAVLYHNLGGVMSTVAEQAKGVNVLSKEQKAAISSLASSAPGMIVAYGEPDRILLATQSNLFGVNLSLLGGLAQGKMLHFGPPVEREHQRQKQ